MEDSIFTRIIKGEIPCHKIYEDDRVLAFLDVHPQVEGHTLVVPKVQIDHIWDVSDEDYQYLWQVVKKISLHIKDVTGAPRIGVVVEGFGVPHAHIHLLPIVTADELKQPQDLDSPIDHDVLAAVAAKLAL